MVSSESSVFTGSKTICRAKDNFFGEKIYAFMCIERRCLEVSEVRMKNNDVMKGRSNETRSESLVEC